MVLNTFCRAMRTSPRSILNSSDAAALHDLGVPKLSLRASALQLLLNLLHFEKAFRWIVPEFEMCLTASVSHPDTAQKLVSVAYIDWQSSSEDWSDLSVARVHAAPKAFGPALTGCTVELHGSSRSLSHHVCLTAATRKASLQPKAHTRP